MRFYSARRFPSLLLLLLLLVALTCAARGSSLRARRFVFDDIGNTLNNVGETIKDAVKTGFESLFKQPAKSETTTATQPDTTGNYREIINTPIRCPSNHVIVNNRCRMVAR